MEIESVELVDDPAHQGRTSCQNCGAYVTRTFARVFGDNRDVVHACVECSTMRALRDGSAVEPNR